MSHRRQSFCLILSVSLLLSRRPDHARESVGRRKSPSIIGGANGSAPAATPSPREQYVVVRLSTFSVQEPRHRAQGRRECLPATTCQRSVRASCYEVRSQFWPRGRDTLSAWIEWQPSRTHPSCQIHQTYYFAHLQSRPYHRRSPVARTRFKTLIYLKGFGAGAWVTLA